MIKKTIEYNFEIIPPAFRPACDIERCLRRYERGYEPGAKQQCANQAKYKLEAGGEIKHLCISHMAQQILWHLEN